MFSRKAVIVSVVLFALVLSLSACTSAPEPAPAPEAPAMAAAPAPAPEAPAEAAPPEAPAVVEPPVETEDPDKYVRYDWKPTKEQAEELYNYGLPYICDQPYYVRSEYNNGNNYLVFVNCNPADLDDSVLPFLRAVRDKFYELRDDEHDIVYIGFSDNSGDPYSYDVWYSVEEVN